MRGGDDKRGVNRAPVGKSVGIGYLHNAARPVGARTVGLRGVIRPGAVSLPFIAAEGRLYILAPRNEALPLAIRLRRGSGIGAGCIPMTLQHIIRCSQGIKTSWRRLKGLDC